MKKHSFNQLIVYLILFGVALLPAIGSALDLMIEPRFQAGIMDYEFEQKPISINYGEFTDTDHGFKIVGVMPFVGGGVTLFSNRFFFDLYVQKAFSGSDSATNPLEYEEFDKELGIPVLNTIINSDFDREEFSVSVGYAVGRQWALFGGYRIAKTSFDNNIAFSEDGAVDNTPVNIAVRGNIDSNFKQDGYFLGSAYAFNITEHSVVTLNTALAVLDGEFDSRGTLLLSASIDGEPVEGFEPEEAGYDFDGNTIGLNLGVALKGRIVEKLGYTLGVNGYSYDFDAKEKDVVDLSESVLRFSAGLSYQF